MWGRRIKLLGCASLLLVFLEFLFMLWDAHEHLWEGSGPFIAEGSTWFFLSFLPAKRNTSGHFSPLSFVLGDESRGGEGEGEDGDVAGCGHPPVAAEFVLYISFVCCMAIGGSEMIPVHCLGNGREEVVWGRCGDDGLGARVVRWFKDMWKLS